MRESVKVPSAIRVAAALTAAAACSLASAPWASTAFAFDGLTVTELPPGGDVTVPGDYPIRVPQRVDAVFTGLSTPQSMTITNQANAPGMVHIFAAHEKGVRKIRIAPGTSAVYSLKSAKPVRVKVVEGDVRVNSILPLKVQR